MNIAVLVKQVPDTETKFKLNGNLIDTSAIKWVMSPYDEFAVEEALKLKQAEAGSKITVISLGPKRAQETIRTALAMGADEGVLIETAEGEPLDPQSTAKALAHVLKTKINADLIFSGWKAIDDDASQVSQAVAEHLEIPHAFQVVKFSFGNGKVTAHRELEGGASEVVELSSPCVIACQKGLNTPRYASLPGIMQAKKKPIQEIPLAETGVAFGALQETLSRTLPEPKGSGKIIKPESPDQLGPSVSELVKLLREEAKVI